MEFNGLDKFKLITYQNLDYDERKVVTLLYQPLIGSEALTLYLTLWSLLNPTNLKSPAYFHQKLYEITTLNPRSFEKARKKLEAIGLIVTYHNEEIYLYELKAPLTAEEFIKDGSLGAYLFSKVGKANFNDVVTLFRVKKSSLEGFKNITSNFEEVFEKLPKEIKDDNDYVSRNKSKIKLNHSFDFDVFLEGLSKNYIDRRKLTKSIRQKILNLSYAYDLDEITMQKVFMDSVDKNRDIDEEELSENARQWFSFNKENEPKNTGVSHKEHVSYEDMIDLCKEESPVSILSILSGGKPAVSEVKIVEKLISNFELNNEVINFLLVYVMGQLQEFPVYNYFDKVASNWRRANIKTVEDAIKHLKKRSTKKRYNKHQKNTIPEDIEADWLDEYIENI
ncbi:MAG: DnaD domain protein [Candidatus Izimaplasma sp.]|nr:DnaD domain protein [Candidatus Izimaplasma bacterium]